MAASDLTEHFEGGHVGGDDGLTQQAFITDKSANGRIIGKLCEGAVDVENNEFYKQIKAISETENVAGFPELLTPILINVKGPSEFCITTTCRIVGKYKISAALQEAISWTELAVTDYQRARGKMTAAYKIKFDSNDAVPAVRLATRIIAASRAEQSDSNARRAAKQEFAAAVEYLGRNY